jgi:hypothetical protein
MLGGGQQSGSGAPLPTLRTGTLSPVSMFSSTMHSPDSSTMSQGSAPASSSTTSPGTSSVDDTCSGAAAAVVREQRRRRRRWW